jgi:hypothetical protein
MQQDNDRLTGRGLLGRGAMTGLAALALVGGGAGVALADEAPADSGQDATQSQSHESQSSDQGKSSDEGKSSDDQGSDSPLSNLPVSADSLPVSADSLPVSADSLPVSADSLPVSADSLPSLSGMNAGQVSNAGQAAPSSLPIASSIMG